ncbi:MAG: hypothetical protein OEQ39_04150 [Gammaproteobacteria bacterium]|nr:hypothetical protein [Gammaproteobacteria bacterium]MDH3466196.1 hypothetical protein [Gammaproteobacteria bacterium]
MSDPRGPLWRRPFDGHDCNYPGCKEVVNGQLWGCKEHWYLIPVELRDRWMACSRTRDRDRVAKSIAVHLEITNGV